jgi:prepilin-type N-terminal cleavage/methylation domain-containing protein
VIGPPCTLIPTAIVAGGLVVILDVIRQERSTLIELLVVIAIIGMLVSLLLRRPFNESRT